MKDFKFHNPTKVIFGRGKISEIGKELKRDGIKKVLMVAGKGSIKRNGVYEQTIESLKNNGIKWVELWGIMPNPRLSKVYEGIDIAREDDCDAVLAVGGGSVIDAAKGIAAGIPYDGDVWDFYTGGPPSKVHPIYDILTISATGSEMNGNSVVTKDDTLEKKGMHGAPLTNPRASIIDPSVQFSLPKEQTAYGAIDAITHVAEFYFNGSKELNFPDRLCESLIRTIIDNTDVLLDNPEDYDARAELAWSATMALNGMTAVGRGRGDWASHQIEHALSAIYDIAHGAGLAIVLPAVLEFNRDIHRDKIEQFGERVFGAREDADMVLERLRNMYVEWGAPVRLSDVGIPEEDIPKIASNGSIGYPIGHPRKLSREDVEAILRLAL